MIHRMRFNVARSNAKLDMSLAIVNIVLLLIFFFIATGSPLHGRSFAVEVSETVDLPIDALPQPILIVEPSGSLTFNGEPVLLDGLASALEGEPTVHVLIDREMPALDLVDLLTAPALEGIEILLVTVHLKGEGA